MTAPFAHLSERTIDFGKGLNPFLEESASVVNGFSDSPRHFKVFRKIRELLTDHSIHTLENPEHPFNRFGTYQDEPKSISAIEEATREAFPNRQDRDIFTSIFHVSGIYNDDLWEIMDCYWYYVKCCLGIPQEDDEEEDLEWNNPNRHW